MFMKPTSLSLTFLSLTVWLAMNLTAQVPAPTAPVPAPAAAAPQTGKTAAVASATSPALDPSTMGTKVRWLAYKTVSPGALVRLTVPAGWEMLFPPSRLPHDWKSGAGGFGRQYGHYVAMNSTTFATTFAVASLTGEDPRYHLSADKGFGKRLGHALGSGFVGYSDDGKLRPAFSLWAGSVAGGFVSKTYRPPGFNDTVHAYQNSAWQFGSVVGSNIYQEFRPEVRAMAKKIHLGFLIP